VFNGLANAASAVQVTLTADADVDSGPNEEFVEVAIAGTTYRLWGQQCGSQIASWTVGADDFNAALSRANQLQATVRTGGATDCFCANTWRLDLAFLGAGSTDCNSNGIPDACDITSGFDHDCNGNGQLDACDITQGAEDDNINGYPDPCELDRGDLNLDGEVDGSDLAILLSYWGGVGFPIGDCNRDGIIAGADLAILLGNWGDPL
jgi:hypothetical protein